MREGKKLRGGVEEIEVEATDVSTTGWLKETAGYYEAVSYLGGKVSNECVDPVMKVNYAINVCAPSFSQSGQYMLAWLYADAQANTYYAYNQFFSDPSCDTALTQPALQFQRPILICSQPDQTGWELNHIISKPLDPVTDNLGIALLVYDTQSNCQANNFNQGVLESLYARLNYCYKSKNGDFLYSDCSSSSLTITQYTSTDGSCTGTPTVTILNSGNTCMSGDKNVAGSYLGWETWGCATKPM